MPRHNFVPWYQNFISASLVLMLLYYIRNFVIPFSKKLGHGHAGEIIRLAVSPDRQRVVSVGSEGAIFIWKFPYSE